jgi:UDP-N-acetylglucosamine--N-acetylmuramyl-(pentapeptide) pyrophosphoryl-undecaprenol N-acetylglucosamine transferase
VVRVVITGGGTGGHVFPMAAVAEALERSGVPREQMRFVASRRGQDRRLLADSGIDVLALPGRGIKRSMRPRAFLDNLVALAGLVVAQVRAVWSIGRWRPSVVVSLGGYASVATDLAAGLWRRPLVLVDLDAVPSAAHRLVGRFATARCAGLPSADTGAVVTGAPLRHAIESVDRTNTKTADASRQRWTVVVMTGSLGASSVNRAVVDLVRRWRDRDDLRIIHVTGRRDEAEVRSAVSSLEPGALEYEVVAFAEMAPLWATCDLAVCRAGATTVAELTTLGIPSILVPLPGAPDDHQTKNAQAVVDAGGALLLRDRDVSADTLAVMIDDVLGDRERVLDMGRGAASVGRHHAADEIARIVLASAS